MTNKQGFWTSLPGILTSLATVITAITGLYIAVFSKQPPSTHDVSVQPANITQPTNQPNPHNQPATPVKRELTEADYRSFPKSGPLVVCDNFPTVNTTASLMSWSNYYQQQIEDAQNSKPQYACNKTIGYRAMAHCNEPENKDIRQQLLQTLALCRKLGFEAHQVTLQ